MTESDKESVRYIYAGLAMNGLIQAFVDTKEGVVSADMIVEQSVLIADALMEALEPQVGIAAIKPKRKKVST
jgi:hypothetical protein